MLFRSRTLIKDAFEAKVFYAFQQFSRFALPTPVTGKTAPVIDWPASWSTAFPNTLKSHSYTSFTINHQVAFASKLFLDELPVQLRLSRRFPDAFAPYPLCLLCQQFPESLDHVGVCSSWSPNASGPCTLLRSFNGIVLKMLYHSQPFIDQRYYSEFCDLPIWRISDPYEMNFTWFLRGLVPTYLTAFLTRHRIDISVTDLLQYLHNMVRNDFRKHLWMPRCLQFHRELLARDINLVTSRPRPLPIAPALSGCSASNAANDNDDSMSNSWILQAIQYGTHWSNFRTLTDLFSGFSIIRWPRPLFFRTRAYWLA